MEQRISLTINDQTVEARPEQTVLEVVREQNLDQIPTLCHSPELKPYGSCFVCVVEVEGRRTLVPSCSTRVAPGMKVYTHSDRVKNARKTAFELLLSNHYADCVSPCHEACPAHVDIQGYLALAGMGHEVEAVELIRKSNPLPAICSRICVRRCETACRRAIVDQAVNINAVKRHLCDKPAIYDVKVERAASRGKSVGIVGAGPAGLTAAWFLGLEGYDVVIYEAMPKPGGMLRYGIPAYRLPEAVIDAEVAHICKAGARIEYNVCVGKDVSLAELRKRHDALFVSIGAWAAKGMRVEGEFTTKGVMAGIDYLKQSTDGNAPKAHTVLVVGGGNVAMDVARSAWRNGADNVKILYRRTVAEMPADRIEIAECQEEGIEICELVAPLSVVADENGHCKGLKCQRMALGEPDKSGRRRPVPVEGSDFVIEGDLAISAIGQGVVMKGLETELGAVEDSGRGTIKIDPNTLATNIAGVFAGGDAADDGPTVVIDAIGDGQKAARGISAYLQGKPLPQKPFGVCKDFWQPPTKEQLGAIFDGERREWPVIPVSQRRDIKAELVPGFATEEMQNETSRCLSCGCVRFDDCELRLQAEACGIDMNRFKGRIRKHKIDDRHPFLVYDPNKCVLCARCIRTCAEVLPVPALGLVGRGFSTEVRPAMGEELAMTSCVACGNCIEACPTGALTAKNAFPGRAALAHQTKASHCGRCSVGCPIELVDFGGGHFRVKAGGEPGQYLCKNGRFGHFEDRKRDRVSGILVAGQKASPEAAADAIVKGLRQVKPEEIAVLASPSLTNESLELIRKIAVDALKTPNFTSLSRMKLGALDVSKLGDRAALKDADVIVCNNTALIEDHLVLAHDVLAAVHRGAKLCVVNSTLGARDAVASLQYAVRRGKAGEFWKAILAGGDFDSAEQSCGVSNMAALHDLLAQAAHLVVIDDFDRDTDRAEGDLQAIEALIEGVKASGRKADLLLVRRASNAYGLEICMQNKGLAPIDPSGLKAVLVVGEDPLALEAWAALPKDAFVAVLSEVQTATVARAQVVAPLNAFLEESGTRFTFDGHRQAFEALLPPPAGVSSFEILRAIAQAYGL